MRRWILLLLLLATTLVISQARRKTQILKEQAQLPEEKALVLQTNHFSSQKDTSSTYDLNDIQPDKPILFLLQPADQTQTDQSLQTNPVTITLTAGQDTNSCTMAHLHSLCTLPKTTAAKATLKVQCKQAPCEIRWRIEQPQTLEIDANHELNHLVTVNQDKNHAIIKVYCTDPAIRNQLDTKIQMYTDSKYDKVVNQEGEVTFLFDNEQKGQYFIATGDKAIEKCAVASLEHAEDSIALSKEGVTVTDFFVNKKPNVYSFNSAPQTDIRVEFLLHEVLMQPMHNSTWVQLQLLGMEDSKAQSITTLTLDVDDQKEFIDFDMIFKKPQKIYPNYELHVMTYSEHYLIAAMRFVATDTHEVEITEESYFDLKKGDKINYKLVPLDKEEKNIQTVNFFLSDPNKFKLSRDSCERTGCDFTLEATADGQGYIYIGEDAKKLKAAEVVEEEFDSSIAAKLREGEEKFYLYKMKANDAIQMLVNTPNVIVYVANKASCKGEQLAHCYEKQVSYQSPSIYQSNQDIDLVFLARALDASQFVLTIIDAHQPSIQLKDTQPFVYLMDNKQQRLTLTFSIQENTDVSFNLVAPFHQLNLMVWNKDKLDQSKLQASSGEFSHEGFISFSKDELKSKSFVLVVSKREQAKDKFVHFTLIASTKESNLVLEPSNPHYQKLPSKATRDYVFSLYQDKQLFLNLHTQNQQQLQLKLKLSNVDEYDNASNTVEFAIDRPTQLLSLQAVGQRLCQDQLTECELFARLVNQMDKDVEITLTLMVENAIVELKDGVWQDYDLNKALTSSHFYFLPKNQHHSTTIFYHSSLVNLKVAYTLWQAEDTSVDISQWPFPLPLDQPSKDSSQPIKPPQFIHIDAEQLKKCWPNCVILLSLMPQAAQLDKLDQQPNPSATISHNFKIMASNSLIQIPEKQKLDIVLNRQEDKYLMVDLKKYLDKESIVFFTYFTVGSTQLRANLYSEQNPRCPTTEEVGADFTFIGIETELEMEKVKQLLEENKISEQHPQLCILAHGFTQSKFSLEFVAEAKDVKSLQLDTTTPVKLGSGESRIFQIHAHSQFFLKLSRTAGFPYITTKLCNPAKEKDMEQCLQGLANSEQKGEQFVNKVMSLTETACFGCMYYFRVAATENTELNIHAQSQFIQIEMKENTPLTDVLAAAELNKYLITSVADKQLIINIQIMSGDLKVEISDLSSISIKKQNKKGTNNIHISIPPKDLQKPKNEATTTVSSFQFSANFVHLHLTVQSQDPKLPASYIITYSNGQAQTYLEDGLITQYNLISKKTSKFLYSNPSDSQIYLHLSTSEAVSLNNLKVTIFSLQDPNDEDSLSEIKITKQDFKKKIANPTMFLRLPSKSHYIIQVQNQNSKDVLLFIGVNNREIIYLPLDHEFPFKLELKEYMYFVVPAQAAGYLRFTINKCDASQPYVSYTNDYNDFVNENFETQEQVTDSLIYDNVIKVKKAGSLYFKVRAEDLDSSTLTVKASFSKDKFSLNNAKAGNKGNLQYQFLDSQTAQISFSGVVCDKNCGDFSYTAIRSNNVANIIAELVCTSVSFDILNFTLTKQPQIVALKPTSLKDSKLAFTLPIKEDFNYIGVKAVNAKSGAIVYYQPLEITTLKGKLTQVVSTATQPHNLLLIVGTLILLSIVVPLFAYRRMMKKRRAYRPVDYDEMQDSVS